METVGVIPQRAKYNGKIAKPYWRRLFIIAGSTWTSGAVWLVFHHFLMQKGEFGPTPNPMEPWLLELHGAFAFLLTWVFGLIWGVHVSKALPFKRRKITGIAVVSLMIVLTATGYLLYYVGADEPRQIISVCHWALGLVAPVIFFLHRSRKWNRRFRRSVTAQFESTPTPKPYFDRGNSRPDGV